jgi:hypothetical protein
LRARAHVEAHFSLAAMCRATLDLYADLIERSHRGRAGGERG